MKPIKFTLGLLAAVAIALIGLFFMCVNYLACGECFPNMKHKDEQ